MANIGYQALLAKKLIETGDFFGFGHPPLTIILIAVSFMIGDYDEFPVRLLFLIFFIVGGIYTYKLGKLLHSFAVGAIASFLYFFSPLLSLGVFWYWRDTILMVFVTASVYYLCMYSIKRKKRYVSLGGVFAGLALLSKETAFLLFPIYFFVFRQDKHVFRLLSLMAFFALTWLAVYEFLNPSLSHYFLLHNLQNLFVTELGKTPVSVVENFLRFAGYLTPFVFIFALLGFTRLFMKVYPPFPLPFFVPAVTLLLFSFSKTREIRYYFPAVPFMVIFASVAIFEFFAMMPRHNLFRIVIVLSLLGLFGYYVIAFYETLAKQPLEFVNSPKPALISFVLNETKQTDIIVVFDRGDANWVSFYTGRQVLYLPYLAPAKMRYSLVQEVRPRYLVVRRPDIMDMYLSNCRDIRELKGSEYNYSISLCNSFSSDG